MTLIEAFEVPPEADAEFIAGWKRAHPHALHRALRTDVELRFVSVGRADSGDAGDELPFKRHAGLYAVVRVHGTPDGSGGVVRITPFEVPAEEEEERFLAGWDSGRDAFAAQGGYLGSRLHGSLAPADFRFVDIARWSSPLMVARALQRPEFQAAAIPFPSHPALYLVIDGQQSS